MNNYTNLNLGRNVYITITLHIPASSLSLLNGYDLFFDIWRDTASQPFPSFEMFDGSPLPSMMRYFIILRWILVLMNIPTIISCMLPHSGNG